MVDKALSQSLIDKLHIIALSLKFLPHSHTSPACCDDICCKQHSIFNNLLEAQTLVKIPHCLKQKALAELQQLDILSALLVATKSVLPFWM
jgi:hypothetical protein